MKKAAILLLGVALVLSFGCAKKPAEVIIGVWTGTLTLEGEEAQNIVMEFMEDGNFTLTPEGDVPAKGTYEIDDQGNLTGEFTVEEEEIAGKMTGLLEKETIKGEIEMTVKVEVPVTEEEVAPEGEEVAPEKVEEAAPPEGEEEAVPEVKVEEKIVKGTFEVTKGEAPAEEETTEEGGE
ncbi:MAG: hypothetical protein DRH51_07240 [Candidatus Coatesbacteria bacterium]|nr:MAG: hypothetical protein DRH51_07240 [Candidatus Coatesbacteria bacterium]RLC42684.1 MAG: hypothetical protein DRH44_06110 [Candidatus Coatesbacteria bacterium]RLC43300.1 MAG: hypothetical protein DRH49_01670 [Candidatus Coatesbacteria bacterium]HEC80242.1 hypothetical protein [Bacillota bacterium]